MDSWFQIDDTCVNKVGDKIIPLYLTSLLLYTPYSKDEILKMCAMHLDCNMIKMIGNFDQVSDILYYKMIYCIYKIYILKSQEE